MLIIAFLSIPSPSNRRVEFGKSTGSLWKSRCQTQGSSKEQEAKPGEEWRRTTLHFCLSQDIRILGYRVKTSETTYSSLDQLGLEENERRRGEEKRVGLCLLLSSSSTTSQKQPLWWDLGSEGKRPLGEPATPVINLSPQSIASCQRKSS